MIEFHPGIQLDGAPEAPLGPNVIAAPETCQSLLVQPRVLPVRAERARRCEERAEHNRDERPWSSLREFMLIAHVPCFIME